LAFQQGDYNIAPTKQQCITQNQQSHFNLRRKDMAINPEALSYFLKLREGTIVPEGVDKSTHIVNEVVKFCMDGLRDDNGVHLLDEDGAEITGSIEWLIGEGVEAANFYTTTTPVPMLFCLLSKNGSSNWTELPAFMQFVEIGPVTLAPGNLTLTSQAALDERFQERRTEIAGVPLPQRLAVLAALRGEGNLVETSKWVNTINREEGLAEISLS
jgi:hypothetical protein